MGEQLISIPGIHHVTAIAGSPQQNVDFYAGVLGLRLVKKTVNFDDPGTYHLYYGDETGRPGTIMTFFPWPGASRGRATTGMVSAVGFGVPEGSLGYWRERLEDQGARQISRLGKPLLALADPDGLPLELLEVAGNGGWGVGPVPEEHAIIGLSGVTMTIDTPERTRPVLELMGYDGVEEGDNRLAFTSGSGAIGNRIDLVVPDYVERGRMGAGTVHHVAFRARSEEEQIAWREALISHGLDVTPVVDRQYFKSIYFRIPGGVLFEIATDAPGFLRDEEPGELGLALKLPPWLEPQRDRIERILPELSVPAQS